MPHGNHLRVVMLLMIGDDMTTQYADHFVRAIPIVGQTLRAKRVAVLGLPLATPMVEYLAACGVGNWIIAAEAIDSETVSLLLAGLQARHGTALAPIQKTFPLLVWAAAIRDDPPDLIIAVGDRPMLAIGRRAAEAARIPTLLCTPPSSHAACWAEVVFSGTHALAALQPARSMVDYAPAANTAAIDEWDWACAAPLLAGLARAILLRGSPYARPDLEELWERGIRIVTHAGTHPFAAEWSLPTAAIGAIPARFQTPPRRRGALLIAGLGSIGSVAAALLAPYANQLVLADPDSVDPPNPARQHYTLADLGRPKVQALQQHLATHCPQIIALPEAVTDEGRVTALIGQYGITVALIATGSNADFAIARALRDSGVPHVVARCYPRARYWEAILVDGLRGPALDSIRGRVQLGPAPAPTPEQIAAYSDAGALESEPATLIESGWAAVWAARLAWQLLTPSGLRERWMIELLESQQTCLVGGAYVEHTSAGPAYAIDLPGRIRAWGTQQIRGAV
jgi:hypothetical protein